MSVQNAYKFNDSETSYEGPGGFNKHKRSHRKGAKHMGASKRAATTGRETFDYQGMSIGDVLGNSLVSGALEGFGLGSMFGGGSGGPSVSTNFGKFLESSLGKVGQANAEALKKYGSGPGKRTWK